MLPSRIGVDRGPSSAIDPTGSFVPYPEICFRDSVHGAAYAFLIDTIGGWVADRAAGDDWVTTTDLSFRVPKVHIPGLVRAVASPLRVGRRIISAQVRLTDETDAEIGYGIASFSRVPVRPDDRRRPHMDEMPSIKSPPMTEPLATAAGCEVVDAAQGVVRTELIPELLNPMAALQGGMTALIAEVAAVAVTDHHLETEHVVTGMEIHYHAMGRVGPIVTEAAVIGEPEERSGSGISARALLRDVGVDNRIIASVLVSLDRP